MMIQWGYYATRRPRQLFGLSASLWRGVGADVAVAYVAPQLTISRLHPNTQTISRKHAQTQSIARQHAGTVEVSSE